MREQRHTTSNVVGISTVDSMNGLEVFGSCCSAPRISFSVLGMLKTQHHKSGVPQMAKVKLGEKVWGIASCKTVFFSTTFREPLVIDIRTSLQS